MLTPAVLQRLGSIIECHPALVVLGQSCQAKAVLVNALLGEVILPPGGSSWRWVRFLYGLSSHIAVTLSSDFEVVEDLQAHEKAWTVVPEEDLRRSEAEEKVTMSGFNENILWSYFLFNKTDLKEPILYISVTLPVFTEILSYIYTSKLCLFTGETLISFTFSLTFMYLFIIF